MQNKEEDVFEPVSYFLEYDDIVINNEFKKYTGIMLCYDLDGNITKVPAVYAYINIHDDIDYWTNVLEWNFVKKRRKLTRYIKYQLNKKVSNDTIFLEKELFEDGGLFSEPKNYRKLMESLLS